MEKSMKSDGWGGCWDIPSLLGTGGDRVRVRQAENSRSQAFLLLSHLPACYDGRVWGRVTSWARILPHPFNPTPTPLPACQGTVQRKGKHAVIQVPWRLLSLFPPGPCAVMHIITVKMDFRNEHLHFLRKHKYKEETTSQSCSVNESIWSDIHLRPKLLKCM